MKRFGLIGNPVAGSLSPRLFEAAYGGRYTYDLIEGAEFAASWQRFLDEYDGINITAPFKQDAFNAVDHLSDDARLCGAVNLAVKTPDGLVGYNTDVDGVVLSVREVGLPVSEALVVGCGGAGRAAAVAALRLGCHVTLANRTIDKALSLAADLTGRRCSKAAAGPTFPAVAGCCSRPSRGIRFLRGKRPTPMRCSGFFANLGV